MALKTVSTLPIIDTPGNIFLLQKAVEKRFPIAEVRLNNILAKSVEIRFIVPGIMAAMVFNIELFAEGFVLGLRAEKEKHNIIEPGCYPKSTYIH